VLQDVLGSVGGNPPNPPELYRFDSFRPASPAQALGVQTDEGCENLKWNQSEVFKLCAVWRGSVSPHAGTLGRVPASTKTLDVTAPNGAL
jgi:hypothetical protein